MMTPGYVLDPIRKLFGGEIGLDPCAEEDNSTGALRWYFPPSDGCEMEWDATTVFCNPPYGEARSRWVERCIEEGKRREVVLLIPSHTDTRIFQRALSECINVVFVRGRLKFGVLRPDRRQEASHGSAIFGFGVNVRPLSPELGVCMIRI